MPSSRLVGFLVFQSRFYGPQHLRYSPDSIPGQQAGLPLAAGYSATLIALAGDLEYFNHSLSLPRWSSNTSCCPHCRATKQGAYSWTDFKSSAQWHDVIWTPQSWHLWDQRSPCRVFKEIPGLSGLNAALDYMHIKHLGTDQYCLSAVLYYLTHIWLPGSPAENAVHIWKQVQEAYKVLGVSDRFYDLSKINMFVKKNTCKLKGKAAQVKGLVLPLAHVWEAHYNPHCLVHRKIRAMLIANATMELLMTKNKKLTAFPSADALKMRNQCHVMAHLMWDLSQHFAAEEGLPHMFICTSKLHMLVHICEYTQAVPPRLFWCYSAEDFMGVIRKICRNCAKGTPPLQGGQKALEHWRMLFALQLEQT